MAYTAVDKATDHFKTVLYTGTHSSVPTITVGFKSDFLWMKSRTQTYDHNVLDTTRGGSSKMFPSHDPWGLTHLLLGHLVEKLLH